MITRNEWLNQFKTELSNIQKTLDEVKIPNDFLQDMQYINKEMIAAQNSGYLTFLSHLNSAKSKSDKYFLNNELIENQIAKDEISLLVLVAYRNFANSYKDVTDKPAVSLPGAPDYPTRLASIDKFLKKFGKEVEATSELHTPRLANR